MRRRYVGFPVLNRDKRLVGVVALCRSWSFRTGPGFIRPNRNFRKLATKKGAELVGISKAGSVAHQTTGRGEVAPFIHPGNAWTAQGAKGKISFSGQITDRIYKGTGLRITLHGHRNVQTTINAYVGLESIQASEIYSQIVLQHMGDELESAE
jgi:hypothetical protein